MILYTTMPEEQIFPTDPSEYGEQQLIDYQGVPMLVQRVENTYRIVRIMSCDPAHYLNEELCPGQYIQTF